jgi:hypothetical protein
MNPYQYNNAGLAAAEQEISDLRESYHHLFARYLELRKAAEDLLMTPDSTEARYFTYKLHQILSKQK